MKRLFILSIVFLISFSFLCGQKKKRDELFMEAIQERNPQQKMVKLQEYLELQGRREDNLTRILYFHLATTAHQVKEYEKTIEYGERALSYKDQDEANKLSLYLYMADAHFILKDPDKAYDYAQMTIELGNNLNASRNDNQIKNNFIAPAMELQVRIIESRSNGDENQIKVFDKLIDIYQVNPSPRYLQMIMAYANQLLQKNNIDKVIENLEKAFNINRGLEIARALGQLYNQKGDRERTLEYFKITYEMQKNAVTAYNIGVLLLPREEIESLQAVLEQGENVDFANIAFRDHLEESMRYLAEASLLKDEKFSPQAETLLHSLFFKIKVFIDQTPVDEQETLYHELLAAARARLGIEQEETAENQG